MADRWPLPLHEIHIAMLTVAAVLWLSWLAGCSAETARHMTPPAVAVGCGTLDVVTTVIGRNAYGLDEANPLMRDYAVFIGAKVGLFAALWAWNRWITPVPAALWWGVAAGNCGIAAWNGAQIVREAR